MGNLFCWYFTPRAGIDGLLAKINGQTGCRKLFAGKLRLLPGLTLSLLYDACFSVK